MTPTQEEAEKRDRSKRKRYDDDRSESSGSINDDSSDIIEELLPSPIALEKHRDLWLPDGSVVFRCQDVGFRLYKGLLSRNSPIFRNMLEIPQPDDVSTFEGCPVIELPDSARDVEYLFKTLLEQGYFEDIAEHGRIDQTFNIVAGVLRLSTKYLFPRLRKKAIEHLVTMFPSSFSEYKKHSDQPSKLAIFHPFAVISLARELDVPAVIPSAYYFALSMFDYETVLFEYTHSPLGASYPLSMADQNTFHYARNRLMNYLKQGLRPLADGELYAQTCVTRGACRQAQRDGWKFCIDLFVGVERMQVLRAFSRAISECRVCGHCVAGLQSTMKDQRRKLWEDLPSLVNLPHWRELVSNDIDLDLDD